jgi:acetate kinase
MTMNESGPLLAINGGSSSIRFALYEEVEPLLRRLVGRWIASVRAE